MSIIYNFSAGPAVLPKEVLQRAQQEMLDWHGRGMSVMEMSHRGEEFMSIIAKTESDLRELVGIPHHYKILFLQGGASSQFAMVPMNLLRGKRKADYVNTGQWSQKAIDEARKYCQVNIAASSEDARFTYAPPSKSWVIDPDTAYVHYTPNETIGGVEFNWVPDMAQITGGKIDAPLVADMTLNILSRPLDITPSGLIYAGAS
ncbi:3-phosphoserine/phosphohydroxythreonine transaminase, partial [Nitrosomonas nitrosa]|uniref:3-phosphoserine/phosphohydroxythreonine transaminase n=1 Tax=Nitrosomonas nitrosa TaxID=52442 RepID=UPI0023F76C50